MFVGLVGPYCSSLFWPRTSLDMTRALHLPGKATKALHRIPHKTLHALHQFCKAQFVLISDVNKTSTDAYLGVKFQCHPFGH